MEILVEVAPSPDAKRDPRNWWEAAAGEEGDRYNNRDESAACLPWNLRRVI